MSINSTSMSCPFREYILHWRVTEHQFKVSSDKVSTMVINMRRGSAGFHTCFGVTRTTMNLMGLWPLDERPNIIKRNVFLIPVVLMAFFIMVPQSQYAVEISDDLNLMLEVLTTADISAVIALIKIFGLWYNKQVLRKLLTQVLKDWRITTSEQQIIMWTNGRIGRIVAVLCISTTIGAVSLHSINFLVVNSSMPKNVSVIKPLYLKSVFPFDTYYSPMYEFICICQLLGVIYVAISFSSFDGLFVCSVLHFSSQLCLLRKRIPTLIMDDNEKTTTFNRILKTLIHEHQHLISYISIIDDNFNKIFLAQILSSSIALCLQGYLFLMATSELGQKNLIELVFSILYLICNLLSLFMHCYFAETIRNESAGLFFAVYDMQWYKLQPKDSRLITILMLRFFSPIEITVGKFSIFSLEYFATVVKTSIGYLSVLLAVNRKNTDKL